MKKEYLKPEFDFKKVTLIKDVLVISSIDPAYTDAPIPSEGGTVPDDDPFA